VKTATCGSLVMDRVGDKMRQGGQRVLPLPGNDPLRDMGTLGHENSAPIKRPHF
jgi:hypothetical protein